MQLNPFEIKAEILSIINDCSDEDDPLVLNLRVKVLDEQEDIFHIEKILFRELLNAKSSEENIMRFLLQRFVPKERLVEQLWAILKNTMASSEAKIIILNYLREFETDYGYTGTNYDVEYDVDRIEFDTKKLLDNAAVNPEVQIDFLDFLNSIDTDDKMLLVKSLGEDYSHDELANILLPVFLSQPDSEIGKETLNLLGGSRSGLAYHALNTAYGYLDENIKPLVKKNLNLLKLSGIRDDNSREFYKNMLADSRPYRCCAAYPDGHGNQALIFSRINKNKRVKFAAVVMNDYTGIRDCFGFNDISAFECDKIIERFYRNEKNIITTPSVLKTLLSYGEHISQYKTSKYLLPYEYVCWKNLLSDIDNDDISIEKFLNKNLKRKKLKSEDLENVMNNDCFEHWFLDSKYGSEFEAFLEYCDVNIQNRNFDLDAAIEAELYNIFYPHEYEVWHKRLFVCAYMLFHDKKTEAAWILFNLYYDEILFKKFLIHIVRRSIYEYYFSLKFNTEYNNNKFTLKQLDGIISSIEDKWVKNV